MTSGEGADPSRQWSVIHEAALTWWMLRRTPDDRTLARFDDWVRKCREDGPPEDGVVLWPDDDLSLARLPFTDVLVSYRVIEYERLIIVREIA